MKQPTGCSRIWCKSTGQPFRIDQVANGEFWHARDALALNLVDEIRTSDEYLYEASLDSDLYRIRARQGLRRRLGLRRLAESVMDRCAVALPSQFVE